MSMPVRIVVAEPSVIIRSGMLSILKRLSNLQVELFETGDMEQLGNTLAWHKPDVLMVNPSFPGVPSPPQIRKEAGNPHLKCVALQNSLVDGAVLNAYDEVISIYDSADRIQEKLTGLVNAPREDMRHEALSGREKEVVVCVVKGMTNKQIADHLCLSTHTVITHRRNISHKLGIHSAAGLTIYAIVNKLVDVDEIKDL